MKVAFLLDRPTQFDGPFFRHVAKTKPDALTVFYLHEGSFDQELRRRIEWGIDLASGYESKPVPRRGWLRWLWQELRRQRYDCLIVNGYNLAPFLAAALIAVARGIRVCVRIDSVLFNQGGGVKRTAKRAAYALLRRLYYRFLATGTLAAQHLRHFGIPDEQIGRFPYTVDTAYFERATQAARAERGEARRRWGIDPQARVALVVAKFNAREAPWDLLRAAQSLDPAGRLALVLAGDGADREALEGFARERVAIPTSFLGYVPYVELPSLYACADVFVHAAADERWGVSVHEAIAAGLPVVASTRVGAAYDLVLEGENGYLYASGDPGDLREKLERVARLEPGVVLRANRRILERWNYDHAWEEIRSACA